MKKVITAGRHNVGENVARSVTTLRAALWYARQGYPVIPTGFVVIDANDHHTGDRSLAELVARFGEAPATVEAKTGCGDRHLLFKHPGGHVPNSAGRLEPGLDVREVGIPERQPKRKR